MARADVRRGITRLEVLVVALVGVLIVAMIVPACRHARTDASREVCLAHLAEIGKAMRLYANDHEGKFPQPGGRDSTWCPTISKWNASTRQQAFGTAADGGGGKASITSAFYLLVKYAGLQPKHCVCPDEVGTTEFKLSDVLGVPEGFALVDAWDFGPQAARHCSYAYHPPFGACALSMSSDPRMAVAADRNPWLLGPAGEPEPFALFQKDPSARRGNSRSHNQEGQNVLFVDGHVSFQNRSDCGVDRDNIYTIADPASGGPTLGVVPTYYSYRPANRKDSVLVHDAVTYGTPTVSQPKEFDSKDLKQTAVVATLDCPLPEHKNVIWCSTFQMAWDKFKSDLVGAPIKILGAEDLADRLNRGTFPMANIEPKSYYAAAGFVEGGIIEKIQKDMASRFPREPAPAFGREYRQLPKVAIAFAYLNVDIGFAYPYYVNDRPFAFNTSDGRKIDVTSFRTYAPGENNAMVRGQVDILFYEFGDTPERDQFVVDLCIHTEPYQVIVAHMPRCGTLGETYRAMQEKIAKFKDDPDYAVLSKLRPIDSLTAPDVLYKLTHRFDELLGKHFGNEKWQEYFIFEALQKIDFTLSRTGVVLKSTAMMGGTASRPPQQVAKPRHLRFDKPFLICVKKREPEATPFFLMWVDNAELMQPATAGQ
jgi:prepilin-type processing-associated H-X9-DG protein